MNVEDVIRAVNALDLKAFSLENVEILQRMLPTEAEVRFYRVNFFFFKSNSFHFLQAKAFRDYAISKKSLDLLTEEDRFTYRLSFTERLSTKLNVMNYIGNFFDNIHLITPVSVCCICFLLILKQSLFFFTANPSDIIGVAICCPIKEITEAFGSHIGVW